MTIMVALSRFPWPIEKGDKLRAWYQLKGLAKHHEVHLICLNEAPVSSEDLKQVDFCASVEVIVQRKAGIYLNLASGLFNTIPFQVNYFRSGKMKSRMREIILEKKIDVVYVQLIRLGENLPFDAPTAWCLDYMDTFSIGMETRVEQTGWLERPWARKEARRLRAYEATIASSFDELTVISERDAEGLSPSIQDEVHIVPNGTGDIFFEDLPQPATQDFDLVFFGNMGYHPNVQSGRFLVEEVMPLLQKQGLKPRLCIAGARPAPLLKSYASDSITVTGFVDDIRTWVLRAKLAIAPLIAGQGLQNKLLESMALGVPTLTTDLANSALKAKPGEEIIVCDDAADFARQIQFLLDNPAKAKEIGAAGKAFVEKNFRWEAMNAKLEKILQAAVDGKK